MKSREELETELQKEFEKEWPRRPKKWGLSRGPRWVIILLMLPSLFCVVLLIFLLRIWFHNLLK